MGYAVAITASGSTPKFGDRDLAQPELLCLAGDRHREGVDGLPVARDLVRRDPAAAGGHEALVGQGRAFAQLVTRAIASSPHGRVRHPCRILQSAQRRDYCRGTVDPGDSRPRKLMTGNMLGRLPDSRARRAIRTRT
jgi:hypothetical protein